MDIISRSDFGTLIAYLLPGFVIIAGGSVCSPTLAEWLGQTSACSTSLSGFLYVVLASLLAGLTASTIRWFVFDTLHHRTGLRPRDWNLSRLRDNADAFGLFIEIHYRYYQFYGNMIVAILVAYISSWTCEPSRSLGLVDLGLTLLVALFFAGSRDALRKYYGRIERLLSSK